MPLVDVRARFVALGRRWDFYDIPVEVSLSIDEQPLPGSPVVVYGIRTFIEFLDACTDASFAQTQRMMFALAEKPHSTECTGMYFEPDTLASFLGGVIWWNPVPLSVYRGWRPPA